MYEFWYDYIEPKYQNNAKNAKLFHMDTDSFIAHIKTEDFCKDVVGAAAKRYDTSDHKADRPLPKEMDKKVIDLMKDELKGKIIKEFVTARPKTYSYLTDDDRNVIKTKGTKKSMIKRILNFDGYKDCLFKNEIILKSKQRFKSEANCVYTEEVNKITQSSSDDKRLQTFDRIRTYPYGTNAFKVCKSEMLSKYK